MNNKNTNPAIFNIGVVERRTGIKADLVRAWERRYKAVVPQRTPMDRRLYTEADIRKLELLRDLVQQGHRISHIASLPSPELEALVQPPEQELNEGGSLSEQANAEEHMGVCLKAIENLDSHTLTLALEHASFAFGRMRLVESLLVPLMSRVGQLWQQGQLDPAQEHMATATIRNFISSYLTLSAPGNAPVLVVSTPVGQQHELGAIICAATASACGWRVAYLGPSLPARSILLAAHRLNAKAIALSITYSEVQETKAELKSLIAELKDVTLMVGGRGALALEEFDKRGLMIIKSLTDFRQLLETLDSPASTGH